MSDAAARLTAPIVPASVKGRWQDGIADVVEGKFEGHQVQGRENAREERRNGEEHVGRQLGRERPAEQPPWGGGDDSQSAPQRETRNE